MYLEKKLLKLFNLRERELGRLIFAWFSKLVFQVGYISLWTMLVSILVSSIGAEMLPSLFMANALLIIIGTAICTKVLSHSAVRKNIMLLSLFSLILVVGSAALMTSSSFLAYILALVSFSFMFAQIKIKMGEFAEHIFSPSEGPRVFPVIESAETIGGLAAGLIALAITSTSSAEVLIAVPLCSSLILGLMLMLYPKLISSVPKYRSHVSNLKHKSVSASFRSNMRKIAKHPFLSSMLCIIVLNVVMYQFMEFQFANIASAHGDGAEHIVKAFGKFHIAFGLVGLVIQCFLASRILERLGLARAIFFHPMMTMLSVIGMYFNFSYVNTFLAKLSYESTEIIHENAYHSSLYMVPKQDRGIIKHFFDGIAAPVGTLIGTLFIIIATSIFPQMTVEQSVLINMFSFSTLVAMLWLSYSLGEKFTRFAKENIDSDSVLSKADSIELLAANNQDKSLGVTAIMLEKLRSDAESAQIKCLILKSLGEIEDVNTLHDIMNFVYSEDKSLKLEAITALSKFSNIAEEFKELGFAKEKLKRTLLDIIDDTEQQELHARVIHLYARMFRYEAAPFVNHLLKSENISHVRSAILICRNFSDRELIPCIYPFLDAEHVRLQTAAIVALWQFKDLRPQLEEKLHELVQNCQEKDIRYIFNAISDTASDKYLDFIKEFNHHESDHIHNESIFALAKLGDKYAIRHLVDLVFHDHNDTSESALGVLSSIRGPYRKLIHRIIHNRATERIHEIMSETEYGSLEELSTRSLEHLRSNYELVGEIIEVARLDSIISKRAES